MFILRDVHLIAWILLLQLSGYKIVILYETPLMAKIREGIPHHLLIAHVHRESSPNGWEGSIDSAQLIEGFLLVRLGHCDVKCVECLPLVLLLQVSVQIERSFLAGAARFNLNGWGITLTELCLLALLGWGDSGLAFFFVLPAATIVSVVLIDYITNGFAFLFLNFIHF
jgi:hypothetical protein